MELSVSTPSIIMMVISMLVSIIVPWVLFGILWRKYKCSPAAFFVGAGVMFVFAFVLEQVMHTIVLSMPGVGSTIQENIFLYGLYGGLAAGVFEETGRFVAFKTLLRKKEETKTAVMYGVGHGGFEASYLLGVGMISNLIIAIMINAGMTDMLFVGVPQDMAVQVEAQLINLAETPWYLFDVGLIERGAAMIAQVALSVLVWYGVKKHWAWFPLAIFLHFLLDFIVVIVNGLTQNVALVEVLCYIMAIAYAVLAWRVYKRYDNACDLKEDDLPEVKSDSVLDYEN